MASHSRPLGQFHLHRRQAWPTGRPALPLALAVARAVGASEVSRFTDSHGRTMIRHVVRLRE
jgi:hypothetical protein